MFIRQFIQHNFVDIYNDYFGDTPPKKVVVTDKDKLLKIATRYFKDEYVGMRDISECELNNMLIDLNRKMQHCIIGIPWTELHAEPGARRDDNATVNMLTNPSSAFYSISHASIGYVKWYLQNGVDMWNVQRKDLYESQVSAVVSDYFEECIAVVDIYINAKRNSKNKDITQETNMLAAVGNTIEGISHRFKDMARGIRTCMGVRKPLDKKYESIHRLVKYHVRGIYEYYRAYCPVLHNKRTYSPADGVSLILKPIEPLTLSTHGSMVVSGADRIYVLLLILFRMVADEVIRETQPSFVGMDYRYIYDNNYIDRVLTNSKYPKLYKRYTCTTPVEFALWKNALLLDAFYHDDSKMDLIVEAASKDAQRFIYNKNRPNTFAGVMVSRKFF